MDLSDLKDNLHRTVKTVLDSGEVGTIEAAMRLFESYKIQIVVGQGTRCNPALQATALTAVNCAVRTFLGGVSVVMEPDDIPLAVRFPNCNDLAEAINRLGGSLCEQAIPGVPTLVIGSQSGNTPDPLAIRAVVSGWSGGVVPARTSRHEDRASSFTPAGVLAGALGVSEVFQRVRQSQPMACRRSTGLNLWRYEQEWESQDNGPELDRLPEMAWIIGLGNLGQAYIWNLGLLPYGNVSARLVLQDFDFVSHSNLSTSLLTTRPLVGSRKTRAVASWAESLGFDTTVIERPFADNFQVGSDEPPVALAGVDNVAARRSLEDVGFTRIIEAGLGGGPSDYLGIDLHSFPSSKRAQDTWSGHRRPESVADQPAYRNLQNRTSDRCGIVQVADRSVGAPFVGAIAGAMVVAELVRTVLGYHHYERVSCHLRDLGSRTVSTGTTLTPFNAGSVYVS